MTMRRAFLTATAFCLSAGVAQAQSAEDFYRGKQVSLIVSSEPGGGYDATARITARHLPKHLPGSPTIVVQNMPGAGGIRAPNYVYTVSPKDGSVFALMQNTIPFEPLVGNKAATFDATKLLWLARRMSSRGYSPSGTLAVKTLDDLLKTEIRRCACGFLRRPPIIRAAHRSARRKAAHGAGISEFECLTASDGARGSGFVPEFLQFHDAVPPHMAEGRQDPHPRAMGTLQGGWLLAMCPFCRKS